MSNETLMTDAASEAVGQFHSNISGWIGKEANAELLRRFSVQNWPRGLQSTMGIYTRGEWDEYGRIHNVCRVLLQADDVNIGKYSRKGFQFDGYVHPSARPQDVIPEYRRNPKVAGGNPVRESLNAYRQRQQAADQDREAVQSEAAEAEALKMAAQALLPDTRNEFMERMSDEQKAETAAMMERIRSAQNQMPDPSTMTTSPGDTGLATLEAFASPAMFEDK